MASSEAPTGRPRGGKVVKVRGAARARAIELITNPRRQYGAFPTSPPYCRLSIFDFVHGTSPSWALNVHFLRTGPYHFKVARVSLLVVWGRWGGRSRLEFRILECGFFCSGSVVGGEGRKLAPRFPDLGAISLSLIS